MRQLLSRALALLRRPLVLLSVLLLAVGGSALVFVPLFGVPGYELGQALTLGVGVLGGVIGVLAAWQERRLIQGRDPRPKDARRFDHPMASAGMAVGAAAFWNVLVLAPPFLVALGYSLLSTRCNPLATMGFFPMLTLPSAILASAAGVLVGFVTRKWWTALALYLLALFISGVVTVWPIYFGPQVFAFNHFLGYFPGPLYDEALVLRDALYWFRLQTLLIAAALWLFTAFCLDMREGRVRRPHFRPASAVLLAAIVFAIAAIEERGPVLGLRMTERHLVDRLGGIRETPNFRIVYFRGKPQEELDRLERDLEFRHHQILSFLGEAPKEKLHVFVYRSPEEKQALVGAGGTQFAKPWQRAVHINDAPFPHPVLKHELLHVMAAPFGTGPFHTTARFGVFAQMAIVEGLAVAGDNRMDDLTLHQWAAAMRKRELAPDLRVVFSPDGFYRVSPSRAYTLSGSFLRFLAETYGTEKLRHLYGAGDFPLAYGKSLDALATEWEQYVDQVPLDARAEAQAEQRFRRPSLFARPCAREVAALEGSAAEFLYSDPAQALELYQRCAKLQPDEPAYKLGQARALARMGREPEADELLARYGETLTDKPSVEAEVAMARGDVAWAMGRPDVATDQYQRVISQQPAPMVDRTARVKLAAVGMPVREQPIHAYFQQGQEDVKLFVLREALEQAPDDPYLHYLIGRRLTQGSAPALAIKHLDRAAKGELPEIIHRETLRLRLQARYLAGDCAGVQEDVQTLPDYGVAFALSSREWAERCDFEARVYKGPLVPEGPFR